MSEIPSSLLTSDSAGLGAAFGAPQWGIFSSSGAPILTVDSVASVRYARDYRISDYPQEQGAFQSYNKVQVPFQFRVGFLIAASRFSFLANIEAAVQSLNPVTLITPEISYPSANLTHYDYDRTERNGKTMILVTVWGEEVRVTAGAQLGSSGNNTNPTTASNPTGSTSATSPEIASVGANNTGELSSGGALTTTQSTNAAAPTESGQVQPIDQDPFNVFANVPNFSLDPK